MNVSLLVPLADPQDPVRAAHWSWLKERWQETLPASWAICEGSAPAEPWIKAHAVQAASEAALHGVWIVIDADVLLDPGVLVEAARSIAAGEAAWVHPHRVVYRLGPPYTEQVTAHPPGTPNDELPLLTHRAALDRNIYQGSAGGGAVAVSSSAYSEVGGFDPRFVGWGGEDVSFGRALETLCGPPSSLGAPMWHLWHPPQRRPDNPHPVQRKASIESDELSGRYRDACGDPARMKALIDERR